MTSKIDIHFEDLLRSISIHHPRVETCTMSELSELIRAMDYIRAELDDLMRSKFCEI